MKESNQIINIIDIIKNVLSCVSGLSETIGGLENYDISGDQLYLAANIPKNQSEELEKALNIMNDLI